MNARRLEELSLNAWPAHEQVLYDGWLLRFAGGYSKRANSVQALYPGGLDLDEKVRFCESMYRYKGQAVIFKLTPATKPANLDAVLEELGDARQESTLVQTCVLENCLPKGNGQGTLRTWESVSRQWLQVYADLRELKPEVRSRQEGMLAAIAPKTCFACLESEEGPLSCGLAVLEGRYVGLFDIVTRRELRGRGHARTLITYLLTWAVQNGANHAYLQVASGNEAARRLYEGIGFRCAYDYWYRIKP